MLRRASVLLAVLLSATSLAWGHYHWVYFAGRDGPYKAIPLKFDLKALPHRTVQYFISREGPAALMPGDSAISFASEIRLAAETWNRVPGSALRMQFGGVADTTAVQSTPRIDVVFSDEIPPGVLAQTWPETQSDLTYLSAADSPGFAPILRSRLELRSDLTVDQQASSSDAFFLTLVHEFGHTVGLQHSMTSAVMATSITRSTSKSRPLAADDIAGLATLYPAPDYLASRGVITGKVSAGENGVNLASVVALATDGTAIGGMTLPDGTYSIEGLPPGNYLVYAHPLPPAQFGEAMAAGIIPPYDLAGVPFPAATGFATQFFPGTQDWTQAGTVVVTAGKTAVDVNFSLPLRDAPGIYNMRTFAYLGEPGPVFPVQAPPLLSADRRWLVVQAPGTVIPGTTQLTPGLRFSVVGGPALVEQSTLQYWVGSDGFLLIVADAGLADRATPIALAVNTDTDLYVLPAAFSVVPTAHPQIVSVAGTSDGTGQDFATVTGVNLGADTRIFFDGSQALSVAVNADGTLLAAAPPAVAGQQAAVEAVGANGQTSGQVLGAQPQPVFVYAAAQLPSIQVSPGFLTAGTSSMVRIDGTFTNFRDGSTVIGFGSSDIAVRQTWVLSPTSVVMNVTVSPNATPGTVQVTAVTGLQLVTNQTVVEVHAPDAGTLSIRVPMINPETGMLGAPAGGQFLIDAASLPLDVAGWSIKVGGLDTSFVRTADGKLLVDVPVSVAQGPQAVELSSPSGPAAPPVLMQIDSPPPRILVLVNSSYLLPDTSNPMRAGDHVMLLVAGLDEAAAAIPLDSLHIHLGDVQVQATSVTDTAGGVQWVEVVLPDGSGSENLQWLRIGRGTRVSAPRAVFISAAVPAPDPAPVAPDATAAARR